MAFSVDLSKVRASYGYAALIFISILIVGAVLTKSAVDDRRARADYISLSERDAQAQSKLIQDAFTQIYQGIRTISFLPSVRNIDRYGKSLDSNARESIIQIYKNLRSNVAVSEIYVVPANLEPEHVDPETGSLETPILMFDDEMANQSTEKAAEEEKKITTIAEAEHAKEVEIYEYRALKEQMKLFRESHGSLVEKKGVGNVDLPFVGSPDVLTCDNGDYKKTGKDADRSGIVFSVPFYDMAGKFKGSITAVVRDNVLRDMLPHSNFALINNNYNYLVLPQAAGQESASLDYVKQLKPDPSLIFSTTVKIPTTDPLNGWTLWAGYPDALYMDSADAQNIRTAKWLGLFFAAGFLLVGCGIWRMILANFAATKKSSDALAAQAQEIEWLSKAQEEERANAERERKKMLLALADQFSESVKIAMEHLAESITQTQNSSERVFGIAEETLQRIASAVQSSEAAAETSVQISVAA